MTTTSAPLEVRNLTKRFPVGGGLRREYVHAVDDVSFELHPGKITALVGESGSGKTTVARLLKPHPVPTDVAALIRERLDRLHPQFEGRGLAVSCAVPGPTQLRVDPELLGRILDELLDNAVRYTPDGGAVTVQLLRLPENGVRLAVENSGPGIDAASLAHLFEPFFRGDPARTRSSEGGTGLGLTLVAAIARLHGGHARVSSVPGETTRFEVDIPS